MKARAENPRKPHEMTRPERAWAAYDWFVRQFDRRRYEAITLRNGQIRYTADFSGICHESGQLCLFEVKASDHRAAYTEAARLRVRSFASEFPELRFFVVWPIKGSKLRKWTITEIANGTSRLENETIPNFAQEAPDDPSGPIYQATHQESVLRKARGVSGGDSPAVLPGQSSFLEESAQ